MSSSGLVTDSACFLLLEIDFGGSGDPDFCFLDGLAPSSAPEEPSVRLWVFTFFGEFAVSSALVVALLILRFGFS